MTNLKGKNIVITGAGRSTGKNLATVLAAKGAIIHLSARNLSVADDAVKFIQEKVGGEAYAYACDISKSSDIESFQLAVAEKAPVIDILVNNAAYWLEGELISVSDDEVYEAINSTVTGTILVTKYFIPMLLKSDTPDILTLVSRSGLFNEQNCLAHEAYHAAKHAQAGFVNRLKQNYKNIRVISLYPPNFTSEVEYGSDEWEKVATPTSGNMMSSRAIANIVLFALEQDRICTLETIVLENNIS